MYEHIIQHTFAHNKKKRKKNLRTLTAADAPPVTSADTAPALEVAAALLLSDCRATEAVVCLCPSSPYLASFSGTREPTQEELVRLSNEPAVRALLWRSFAPLNETLRWGEWQETETFLRVKTAGGAGTRPHRDLTHYSAALRKMRSGGVSDIDESSCCFCLSPGDAHPATGACQRCAGGGLTTVWLALHDTVDPAIHSLLHDSATRPHPALAGERILFGGDELHSAPPAPVGSQAQPRLSIDTRFFSHRLPVFRAPPPRTQAHLNRCAELLVADARVAAREGENVRFLLDLFPPSEQYPRDHWRAAGCRGPARDFWGREEPLEDHELDDTAAITFSWMRHTRPASVLQRAFAAQRGQWRAPRFTKRHHAIYRVDTPRVLLATHFVFGLTDWLTAPHRWTDEVLHGVAATDRDEVLLGYLARDCLPALQDHREQNAELYLEVAACVGLLAPESAHILREAAHWAQQSSTVQWARRANEEAERRKVDRHGVCVWMHFHVLVAWIEGCAAEMSPLPHRGDFF